MRKKFPLLIFVLLFAVTACKQSSAPANSSIDTGFQITRPVTDTKPADSLHNMDTTVMVVDSMSHITLNGMPLKKKENNVYQAVYDSWMQAYQKTKHLPLAFKLVQQGTVMMSIRVNIGDAVLKTQNDLKNYIAKDKFKKPFAKLNNTEQENLQQAHPVLFQRPF